MEERKIEKYLVGQVKKAGGKAIKFIPTFFAGFPDRIVLLPYGTVVFVELKATGKKPRSLQNKVHRWLLSLNMNVHVIDSKEKIDNLIKRYEL